MKTADDMQRALARAFSVSIIIAVVAVLLAGVGAFLQPVNFFESYLFAFHFWLALTLGSLAVLGLAVLFNADWTLPLRRPLESGTATLVIMFVLFVPLLLGLKIVFSWADPEFVASSPIVQRKIGYLNVPFFLGRALIYFLLWGVVAWKLVHRSRSQTHPAPRSRSRASSVAAILVYFVTVTLASVDWGMSITPEWYSTGYSFLYIVGQGLTAFAFAVALVLLLSGYGPVLPALSPKRMNDWGNFLLMFVMLWGYLEAVQLIIVWSGNLQIDNSWYYHRAHGGWQYVGTFIILCNFFLPFVVLLFRTAKRRARWLLGVALLLLGVRVIEMFWFIIPSFHPEGFHLHWLHVVVPVAMGGVWMSAFCWDLRRRPIISEYMHAKEAHL